MTVKIGVVMDPIESIKPVKDSTLAMMLAAQARGWELYYLAPNELYLDQGEARARCQTVTVRDDQEDWFSFGAETDGPLGELDAILMRVDPPFDMDYIYITYILERAEAAGALVVNRPNALRDCNEKLFTAWFPEHCPRTVVSASQQRLRDTLTELGDTIIKPLDGMGGASIFRLRADDPNIGVILEHMTLHGKRQCMMQRFMPEIKDGDKRVLVIDGVAVPYTLARIPTKGETRGNLAAGGKGVAMPITEAEQALVDAVAPELKRRGLLFVGLDVIGDKLTEINVTSPTCIRELDSAYGLDIASLLMDAIEAKLQAGEHK